MVLSLASAWGLSSPNAAQALDLDGVLNAALDQPHINVVLYPAGQSTPLSTYGLYLDPDDPSGFAEGDIYNIEAYFDTGAGGSLLGDFTAQSYGVARQSNVTFQDVGVGGVAQFDVSAGLDVRLAPYNAYTTLAQGPTPDFGAYTQAYASQRASIGQANSQTPDTFFDDLDKLIAGLSEFNVLGMPYFAGKTVVLDGRSLNNYIADGGDLLDADALPAVSTYVYDAGSPAAAWKPDQLNTNPGIPNGDVIDYTLPLSYASFDRFTQVVDDQNDPIDAAAFGPTLAHNPFIGTPPASVLEPGSATPAGIDLAEGSHATQNRAFLFDTGAAATMISRGLAQALGVRYVDGTYHTATPLLEKITAGAGDGYVPIESQFELTIGGVGGQVVLAGFVLDELTVPVIRHDPVLGDVPDVIRYLNVPVLIEDIGVEDPLTSERYTLDGIFGMNLLFASTFLDEPFDLFDLLAAQYAYGAYDWVVFDEPAGQVQLSLSPYARIPEPTVLSVLLVLIAHLSLKRPARQREQVCA